MQRNEMFGSYREVFRRVAPPFLNGYSSHVLYFWPFWNNTSVILDQDQALAYNRTYGGFFLYYLFIYLLLVAVESLLESQNFPMVALNLLIECNLLIQSEKDMKTELIFSSRVLFYVHESWGCGCSTLLHLWDGKNNTESMWINGLNGQGGVRGWGCHIFSTRSYNLYLDGGWIRCVYKILACLTFHESFGLCWWIVPI